MVEQVKEKLPEHQAAYQKIRDQILFGDYSPGQPITISGVVEQTGAGVTPAREAIRRLCAEGALEMLGNRRLQVPQLTLSKLEEIKFARLAIEPELARVGALKISEKQIDMMESLDGKVNKAIATGDIKKYLSANFEFHFLLYQAAELNVLKEIALSLWQRIGPSLPIVCGRFGTSNLLDQHSETIKALRAGDAEATSVAIREDLCQGLCLIEQYLLAHAK